MNHNWVKADGGIYYPYGWYCVQCGSLADGPKPDEGGCGERKPAVTSSARADIARVCDEIKALLLRKNDAYGNSALDPVRIFSRANAEEQIRVRLDDKLSRLARGADAGEDVILDLIGYLVLLRVARLQNPPPTPDPSKSGA